MTTEETYLPAKNFAIALIRSASLVSEVPFSSVGKCSLFFRRASATSCSFKTLWINLFALTLISGTPGSGVYFPLMSISYIRLIWHISVPTVMGSGKGFGISELSTSSVVLQRDYWRVIRANLRQTSDSMSRLQLQHSAVERLRLLKCRIVICSKIGRS